MAEELNPTRPEETAEGQSPESSITDAPPTTLEQVDPDAEPQGDGAAPAAEAAEAPAAEEKASLIDRAKGAVAEAAEAVTDRVEDAVEAAGDLIEDATEAVTEAAESAVEAVKEKAADVAHAVSDAVEDVAERIEGSSETVDADAPVALQSADDLQHTGGSLGYTGEIQGEVITLADLEAYESRKDPDEPEDKDEDLLAMYEGSLSAVEEGEIVEGTVVSIGEKEILVDFGFKSTGTVSKNEFREVLEVGDTVEVFLERKEDRLGQPVISKDKADTVRRWQIINDAFENEGVLEGTIVRRIKGGMIVDLLGQEAFLPGSQVDARPVRDFDAYLGRTMEFKVVKTNPANGNVVVSHKALVEKELKAQREKILDTLEVGQILEGQVKNIVDFGVFIDLGGVDGLLHITDLSWGRVGHPSEVVELDQELNVVVLNYEKERQRISLGLKQLQPHPWENIAERFAEGQTVQGRVVSITDYGAFVELEKGIEGLVHISEMSYTEHIKHPTQKVQLGQIVDVKVLNVDEEDKKISLGIKQLEPDPWEGLVERYSVGQILTGAVRNITSFGAFVELEPGIDGLVHVSDLSWTKRVKHPSEVVKKGQELEVIVLDIDIAQRRLSLGHKQVQTDPWQQYATAYAEDTDTTALVTEVTPDGLRVELPLEAPGFIPASQLERGGTNGYVEGDELAVRVIRLDKRDRDIILSETARRRASERAEKQAERFEKSKQLKEERREVRQFQEAEESSRGPATLGELTGLEALKAKMEAQEAEAEGAAPSEAQSKPVEAAQPEEQNPPTTAGPAASEMEGAVGTANRGTLGTDPDEEADPSDGTRTGQNPPKERSQRVEEGGDYPPSEKNQAALKDAPMPTEGLAGQAEAATDDETPASGSAAEPQYAGQGVEQPSDVDVPDVLEQPADEAVAELTGEDDAEGESAEMGQADATVTGEDAEDVADKAG